MFDMPEGEPTCLFVNPFACNCSPLDWRELQAPALACLRCASPCNAEPAARLLCNLPSPHNRLAMHIEKLSCLGPPAALLDHNVTSCGGPCLGAAQEAWR